MRHKLKRNDRRLQVFRVENRTSLLFAEGGDFAEFLEARRFEDKDDPFSTIVVR